MGCAYMVQHQYDEAVKSFSRAIEIVRGQGDAFDVDLLGFPLANLGSAYWLQGRYSTADEVYENALREREKAFGTMDTVSYKFDIQYPKIETKQRKADNL
jgi:tetratricopeptide (TPR) repeat protein